LADNFLGLFLIGPWGEYLRIGSPWLIFKELGSGRGGGGSGVVLGASIICTWSSKDILRLDFCIVPVFFSVETAEF